MIGTRFLRYGLLGSAVVLAAGAAQAAEPVIVSAPPAPAVGRVMVLAAPALATPVMAPLAPQVAVTIELRSPAPSPAAAPVRAALSGWSDREVGAARVRNLQTMMMVGALRCRAIGIDVLTDYNGFVVSARDTLVAVNDAIKARLIATFGIADGEERYDRFTTSLANAFGSDATNAGTCEALRTVVRRASDGAASRATLLQIADSAHLDSGLPSLERGGVQLAAR